MKIYCALDRYERDYVEFFQHSNILEVRIYEDDARTEIGISREDLAELIVNLQDMIDNWE